MSRANRNHFLGIVRKALGHAGDCGRQPPLDLFPKVPSAKSKERIERIRSRKGDNRQALIERLTVAAEPINLKVAVVGSAAEASSAVVAKVVDSQPEWGGLRQACAWNHPLIDSLQLESMLPKHGIPLVTMPTCILPETGQRSEDERNSLRREIAASHVGITAADFCVADTATLVLSTRPGWPRSVSLVPSIHVAVITADQIVADFKELFAALRWGLNSPPVDLTNCLTFISGPSKTADIEATLVHGAHGPRELYLVVVARP